MVLSFPQRLIALRGLAFLCFSGGIWIGERVYLGGYYQNKVEIKVRAILARTVRTYPWSTYSQKGCLGA